MKELVKRNVEYRIHKAAIRELQAYTVDWCQRHDVAMPVLLWVLEVLHKDAARQLAEATGGGFISAVEIIKP